MRYLYNLIVLLCTLCYSATISAQVTGIKNIPADYATLAAAVTALNTSGVGVGGATINVPAGYTETAPAGGYLLGSATLNASLSSANTLTIKKNGAGNNPLITSPVGTTTNLDGIFILIGTDYVTIDGIDLRESAANTTGTTVMEYGYALFNRSSTSPFDGCNNNTIQNCTVTLNRTVATPSKCIFMAHQLYNSTTALAPTAAADLHNNNKFYGNTLTNAITGVYIGGATSANDVGNDIGGSGAATGNTMNNVIGALYSSIGAVTCTYQTNCNISYNNISNTANGGTNAIATAWGIYAYGPSCTYTVTNNTIALQEASISTAYAVYGIYGNAAMANITATNNTVTVSEVSGSAVNNIAIFLPNGNNTTISDNAVTQNMAASGTTYGIYITSSGIAAINNNILKQTSSVATSSQFYSIVSGGNAVSETINNNIFDNSNVSVAGTLGYMTLIYTANVTGNKMITGNAINGTIAHNSSSDMYLILCNPASSINAGTAVIANNNFSNVSKQGSGNLYGFYYAPTVASSQTVKIYSNTLSNFTSGTGTVAGIFLSAGVADSIYDNTIQNFSGAGSHYGVYVTSPAPADLKIYGNNINSLSTTGAAATATGISLQAGTATTVFNNFISNLNAGSASATSESVMGIQANNTTASTTVNLYYNSIYLNASSTGTNFSTSGISHAASGTGTTGNLSMINNIIVNTSTPNGTGITAAFRRSGTAINNYNTVSDNNNFYAGTPSATRLIYYDGTNSDQALTAYKARVTPADASAVSAMPVFVSSTNLHLTPASNCTFESAGKPVTGFTTDIDNTTRSVIRPDIGADEFTSTTAATSVALTAATITGLIPTCNELGWTYYVAPAGGTQYLFAIEWDPTNLGLNTSARSLATVNLTVDPAGVFSVDNPAVPMGTWTMKRYWNVNLNGGVMTNPVNVRFFYDIAEKNATDAAAAAYLVAHPSGSPEPATWFKTKTTTFAADVAHMNADGVYDAMGLVDQNAVAGATINGVRYAQFDGVSSFSGGTYATGVGPNTPLPITLNYLNGVKQGSSNLLTWKVTCNTTPTATLTLERSSDARNFNAVYSITADALRCQSAFEHQDAQPLAGINYYRLKITDAFGKVTYSNIISILNEVKGFEIVGIAPNPVVNGQFKLNVTSAEAAKMNVVITDMQGRVVQQRILTLIGGYNQVDMHVENLAAGTYSISGSTAQRKSKVIRFVKQ